MYIIDRLKKEFPNMSEKLDIYDKFLRNVHGNEEVYKIFDDQKENFKYVYAAYKSLAKTQQPTAEYSRNMCLYENSLNDDKDFLELCVLKLFERDSNMSKKLLILIDVQNDYVNGTLASPDAQAAIHNILKLVQQHEGPVIATHDTHFNEEQIKCLWPTDKDTKPYEQTLEGQGWSAKHCIKLSDGWAMNEEVKAACVEKHNKPPKSFFTIDKYTFGWKDWENFLKNLTDFDEIIIAGFLTDTSVVSNALILRSIFPNMKITVIENACAGITKQTHDAAILTMQMCQIDVEQI